MATSTVNALTALAAAPAVDDVIPIWDLSASAYKKITVANFLGGYMTGAGTVATGGYTLTVPATGTAVLLGNAQTITGAKTFTSSLIAAQIESAQTGGIADDAVYSITPPRTVGVVLLTNISATAAASRRNSTCLVSFDTASPTCNILLQPDTNVEATTGALTGTTGTDAKLTVSAHTDGKIYIENRNGLSVNLNILFFG